MNVICLRNHESVKLMTFSSERKKKSYEREFASKFFFIEMSIQNFFFQQFQFFHL